MSVYEIYYKDGAKMMRPVLSREEYLKLRGSQQQRVVLAAVRGGQKEQKGRLVQMNYSCLPNEDGSLKGSKTMSTTVGMDVDHIATEEMQAVRERILAKREELGLLMLELSARGQGYHLVFRRRPELSQEENLRWASRLLGVEYDKGAKDITRVFFTTTADEEELLYLDDEIFTIDHSQADVAETTNSKEPRNQGKDIPKFPDSLDTKTPQKYDPEARYNGVLFTDIIRKYWELFNGGKEPTEGDRNVLTFELAVTIRSICGYSLERLMQVVPNYWLTSPWPSEGGVCLPGEVSEWRQTLENALKEPKKGMPYRLKQVLQALKSQPEVRGELAEGDFPPAMPSKLPKLVALLTSKTPAMYKAAVAHAVFPPLATHLCGVRFTYTDNVEHEATLMNCLMAGTGSGKGCIDEPISHIMADIERRDAENTRREAEWKKDCQKKGANKDKLLRPEGLVIQVIDPDMTKPALVTRMEEAEGHFVYVKLNELDLFEQLKGQTGKQHFQLMCLAFDPGATYGQTRVGTQSVTARPQCRFNWNACTTLLKGRRFFRKVLTDGPISRINFCTIPENEIGAEQPIYGQYDAAFDEQLKPYIDNLVAARGLIDCQQAHRLAKRLLAECAEFARLSQNDTYWNLSHRACVIAWLKACVLYVANGRKWERSIEDFVRWSLEYDLWCKMQFFGADIDKANRGDDSRMGTRGPRNLLELLPDEFTLEEARRVRQQEGLSNEVGKSKQMIRMWIHRKYVLQITDNSFKKVHSYASTSIEK